MKQLILDGFLIIAGAIAGLAAIWHLLMIFGGPSWYAFARAPQYIVESANAGTFTAPVSAIATAILMLTCTLYSFSAAGLIRKIPLLKFALIIIALVCITRGLVISPLFYPIKLLGTWHLVASSVWFFVGLCFLLGVMKQFNHKLC